MSARGVTVVCLLVVGLAGPVQAHHSQARFDLDTISTLAGTVARFDFTNPHVYLYLETAAEAGTAVTWELEASSTPNLIRRGWSADSVTVGDEITVRIHPPKMSGRHVARLRSFERADGSRLAVRGDGSVIGPVDETATASSLAGTWLGRYGLAQVATHLDSWPLTENGRAALASYDGSQNPQIDCVSVAAPSIMLYSNIYDVALSDDRVVMKTEWMNVERVIYLDGREHPDDDRANQGHSVGHWEGETLVVDTRNFSDNGAGNAFEIPSGAEKHVVERFSLGADRRTIEHEFVLEDPEFLAEPIRGTGVWDYRPDLEAQSTECDPEVARRFLREG